MVTIQHIPPYTTNQKMVMTGGWLVYYCLLLFLIVLPIMTLSVHPQKMPCVQLRTRPSWIASCRTAGCTAGLAARWSSECPHSSPSRARAAWEGPPPAPCLGRNRARDWMGQLWWNWRWMDVDGMINVGNMWNIWWKVVKHGEQKLWNTLRYCKKRPSCVVKCHVSLTTSYNQQPWKRWTRLHHPTQQLRHVYSYLLLTLSFKSTKVGLVWTSLNMV